MPLDANLVIVLTLVASAAAAVYSSVGHGAFALGAAALRYLVRR